MAVKPLPVHGVDISRWQNGKLDMAGAKKRGLLWLYHKATEGASFKDTNYTKRRAEAKKAGLPFGAYHFARPDSAKDAVQEAKFFLATAKPVPGDLRPMLDLESHELSSLAKLREWAAAFVAEVKRQTGVLPIVYTPYDLGSSVKGCLIWRPRYNNQNSPPPMAWDIWQFSNGVYGVPNTLAGFGHVDLNTMRKGLTVAEMLIPKAEPKKTVAQIAKEVIAGKWGNGDDRVKKLKKAGYDPTKVQAEVNRLLAPPKVRLKFAHISLQFNDSDKQHTADVTKIFSRGYDVITGTEAGPGAGNTAAELKRIGKAKGYQVHCSERYGTWVAVKASLVKSGWKTGEEYVLPGSSKTKPKPPGKWGDKGIVWASWVHPTLGAFAVGSVHYLTNGGAGASYKKKSDALYAAKIEAWRKSFPAATEVFIGGDYNRNDKTYDVFMGKAAFLSAADELKEWDSTGHGPIDAIAREKASKRVKGVSVEALDDKALSLHTDHFLLEVVYEVTPL